MTDSIEGTCGDCGRALADTDGSYIWRCRCGYACHMLCSMLHRFTRKCWGTQP